jgi:lipopolysaccharide/colanic/teichoic acid biosynthesis glycosyltransferase
MMKRMLDLISAIIGLLVCAPLFLVVALLIKLDSPGPVFFTQRRIGRGFQPFDIYKFRTMVADAPRQGALLTVGEDSRITRVGHILRRTKIDELPQLLNVLKGDMSLVGPRPEVPRYVEQFRTRYGAILTVRPGMTDLASLKYRDESSILAASPDPEDEYVRTILPDKLRLAEEYIRTSSVRTDLLLVLQTLAKLIGRPPTGTSSKTAV